MDFSKYGFSLNLIYPPYMLQYMGIIECFSHSIVRTHRRSSLYTSWLLKIGRRWRNRFVYYKKKKKKKGENNKKRFASFHPYTYHCNSMCIVCMRLSIHIFIHFNIALCIICWEYIDICASVCLCVCFCPRNVIVFHGGWQREIYDSIFSFVLFLPVLFYSIRPYIHIIFYTILFCDVEFSCFASDICQSFGSLLLLLAGDSSSSISLLNDLVHASVRKQWSIPYCSTFILTSKRVK